MPVTVGVVDVESLARNWWAVVLRGLAGVAFGLVTLVAPAVSLAALVLLFGAYALVDGVFAVVTAVRRGSAGQRWGLVLAQGVAGIVLGAITLLVPGATALLLLYLIAAWALVTGVLEAAAAVALRRTMAHEWLLVLSGATSVILGVLLLVFPGAGALAVVLWIGAYALVSGVMLIALGVRLRSFGRPRRVHPVPAHA